MLAHCARTDTEVNTEVISNKWLLSDSQLTNVDIDNYFPVQLGQPRIKKAMYSLVRRIFEEQCSIVYNFVNQVLYGRMPLTPSRKACRRA